MNARTETAVIQTALQHANDHHLSNAHLDALEEETIFILREVAAAFERPDTAVSQGARTRWSCSSAPRKAFGAGRIPYPLLMIDTGHNFP